MSYNKEEYYSSSSGDNNSRLDKLMVKKYQRYSDKARKSSIKKRKKIMIWDDIVNNDKYFMELNEDGTKMKCSAYDDTKAKV